MVARLIERSHLEHAPLVGLILDMRKAFNSLPRLPLWHCLLQLGFPTDVLRCWVSFVNQQQRRFQVRGSISQPVESCVGLPEGCGLSVLGMVVVDYLLDLWLGALQPQLQLATFVDDWQLVMETARQLNGAWEAITAFTSALDLSIDPDKTFAWASDAEERRLAKQSCWKVSLCSRVLGVHQNFLQKEGRPNDPPFRVTLLPFPPSSPVQMARLGSLLLVLTVLAGRLQRMAFLRRAH